MIRWAMELARDLRDGLISARRQRQAIERMREREETLMANRPTVHTVGDIPIDERGISQGHPAADWSFFFPHGNPWLQEMRMGRPPAHHWIDGVWRLYGYTEAELREFHARRSEFNVNA